MYQNTWSISRPTRISGTGVWQTRRKWYIDRYIPLFHVRGPLSRSMWGSLRLAPIHKMGVPTTLSLVHSMTLALRASWKRLFFFTSQILFLTLNFLTIWLVGCWLTLATHHWNINRVYFSITLMLVMLHWCQRHIVNPALVIQWACAQAGRVPDQTRPYQWCKWHA